MITNLKKVVSIFMILSLIVCISNLCTLNKSYASDEYNIVRNDFAGEKILKVYEEQGDLYVVTAANPLGKSGKCPAKTK